MSDVREVHNAVLQNAGAQTREPFETAMAELSALGQARTVRSRELVSAWLERKLWSRRTQP